MRRLARLSNSLLAFRELILQHLYNSSSNEPVSPPSPFAFKLNFSFPGEHFELPADLVIGNLLPNPLVNFPKSRARMSLQVFISKKAEEIKGKGVGGKVFDWSTGTLLKIINLLLPSSFIQITEGCNINFEGFERRSTILIWNPERNRLDT